MENFSENKRKRGRPLKMLDCGVTRKGYIAEMVKANMSSDGKSGRSHINFYYMLQGQGALADENGNHPFDGEFSFIIAVSDSLEVRAYKRTILQELGRLEDEEVIKGVAREICKNKLTTDRAVTYIRELKIGSKPAGSRFGLAKILAKNIDEYKLKHSEATDGMIRASLDILISVFPENISEMAQEYAEAV